MRPFPALSAGSGVLAQESHAAGFAPRRRAVAELERRAAFRFSSFDSPKFADDRWYEQHVPRADDLYDEHLETIRREGLIDGNDSDQGKDEEVE